MRIFLLLLLLGSVGCTMVRYTAIPKVNSDAVLHNMKFRYRLAGYKVGTTSHDFDQVKQTMEREYPSVFADDGIPFVLLESRTRREENYGWTALLCLCSAFTLPMVMEDKKDCRYVVQIGEISFAEYDIRYEKGSSVTLFSPLGAFFWHGEPDMGGYKGFYGSFFNEKVDADNKYEINRRAIAYGAAVKLRELEIAGKIDPEKIKRKPLSVAQPPTQPVVVKHHKASSSDSDVKVEPDNAIAPVSPASAASNSVQMFEVDSISL